MTQTLPATRLPGWLLGSGVIAVAMAVLNLSTYAFTILAARLLGPSEYGALAAVMGLLLVVNVASLGLQATGARRVSADPDTWAATERDILAAAYRTAVVLGLVGLLAVPLVSWLLRLDGWGAAALMAVCCVPLTIMGAQAGILQGERRWLPLAGVYLAQGLGRIVFGTVALLVSPTATSAMVGVTVGAFLPIALGWYALRYDGRRDRRTRSAALSPGQLGGWAPGGVLREVTQNSHALLAFFALSNADVVIARTMLDDHAGGLYAGGLILAKAVLFLPQFVVVVAFPSMSAGGHRRGVHLKGLAVVLALGLVATLGAALLSELAVAFVGGPDYAGIQDELWAFAAIGMLLAMTQLMVYSVVARQSQRAVLILWAGLAALLLAAPLVDSVTFLLSTVIAVETTVLVVLVVRGLQHRSTPGTRQEVGRAA
ncbi:MAG TPA: oligosaccharide flippase family protein [Nocardioidaceae bacterium]|nr:oligosaccharide flippase family protein [Nocardioidaceae bacterium]